MTTSQHWRQRVGNQRDWVWRGWQTRYTYIRSTQVASPTPLLLLHGFGASIGLWRHNLAALGERHPVYALDLLGFGASQKPVTSYNTVLWSEQVYDFWQTFIRQPVVLVGNSIGSLVCLTLAARYPEMVRGIVMLNLPDASVLETPAWLNWVLAPVTGLLKGMFTFPIVFNSLFGIIRSSPVVRIWARKAYTSPDILTEELLEILSLPAFDRGAAAALRAMIRSKSSAKHDYTARTVLPALQIPMLLLWGRNDVMVPPKLGPLFVKYNSNLTLIEIDDAGHCPHDERPEHVNRLILEWVESWQAQSAAGVLVRE